MSRALPMAGFQVTLHGRFWLTPEFPIECSTGPARQISVYFWYSHVERPTVTYSTIVILRGSDTNCPAIFRRIETVADLLAMELGRHGRLEDFYEFFPGSTDPANQLTS